MTEKQAVQIAHIVLNAQVLLNRLSDYKADYLLRHELKMNTNRLLTTLLKVEKQYFDDLDKHAGEQLEPCYNAMDKFHAKLSNVTIDEMENICLIVDAYRKDKSSIEGIVKKILR
jgi:hypothetical protein